MSEGRKDPLLRIVRILLTGLLWLAAAVGAGGLVAAGTFLARNEFYAARMASNGIDPSGVWWVAVLGVLVAAMAALAFFFVRHLRRIVDSVAEGDPFMPVNAERLRHMAWLTLAFQLVAVPMTDLAVWFDAAPHHPNVHHGTDGISIAMLVLALILFILARVFRQGAAMREDLEGTV
jgi:hypothetical protein